MSPGKTLLPPIVLLLVTFALYATTYHAEFHFDDYAYIVESTEIKNLSGCLAKLTNNPIRPDRIVVTISFAINHALHGFSLPGYHFVNILIHGLNGVLLFLLIKKLSSYRKWDNKNNTLFLNSYLPFGTTIIFLFHPVAVNSVTYISQRHILFATFFYLCSFITYMKAREVAGSRCKVIWFATGLLCFWFAIHSKPMTLTFPFILIAWELIWNTGNRHSHYRIIWGSMFLFCLTISGIFIYAYQAGLFSSDAILAGFASKGLWSPWEHFLTESVVFLNYYKILLLPLPQWLSGDHYFPVIQTITPTVIACWVVHVAILVVSVYSYKKGHKLLALGILWFYITIAPPYLFLPIQDVMVDYKTYLPSVGIFFILYDLGNAAYHKYSAKPIVVIQILVCVILAILTYQRNQIFQTEEAFWSDVIQKYPEESRPYNNRGLAYYRQEKFTKAILDFDRAIQLNPQLDFTYANLGDAYQKMGDHQKAYYSYQKSLALNPNNANTLIRIANINVRRGKWNKAIEIYKQSIELEPQNTLALYNLGLAYAQINDLETALQTYSQAVKIDPSHNQALTAMGAVEYKRGNIAQAKKHLLNSLKVNSRSAETLYNLAACYIKEKDLKNAKTIAGRLLEQDTKKGRFLLNYIEKLQ